MERIRQLQGEATAFAEIVKFSDHLVDGLRGKNIKSGTIK